LSWAKNTGNMLIEVVGRPMTTFSPPALRGAAPVAVMGSNKTQNKSTIKARIFIRNLPLGRTNRENYRVSPRK
jgi:hypothetical protein